MLEQFPATWKDSLHFYDIQVIYGFLHSLQLEHIATMSTSICQPLETANIVSNLYKMPLETKKGLMVLC